MEKRQLEQEHSRMNMMRSISVPPASSPMAKSYATYQNTASTQSTVHEEMEEVARTPTYDDEETCMSVQTEDSMDFLIDDPISGSYSNTEEVHNTNTGMISMYNTLKTSVQHSMTTVPKKVVESYPLPRRFTRSSPGPSLTTSSTVPANPYRGHDFEFMNTTLHDTYGFSNGLEFPVDNFNFKEAKKDIKYLRALKKGDITDDPNLEMVQMWINKLLRTLNKEFDETDEFNNDSDSELV